MLVGGAALAAVLLTVSAHAEQVVVPGVEVGTEGVIMEEARSAAMAEAARRAAGMAGAPAHGRPTGFVIRSEYWDGERYGAVVDVTIAWDESSRDPTGGSAAPDAAPSAAAWGTGQGRLGPVPWALVLPATRGADGRLSVFDPAQSWNAALRVPVESGGIMLVQSSGDLRDQRAHSADALERDPTPALRALATRYGAPAAALVVREPDRVSIHAVRRDGAAAFGEVDAANATDKDLVPLVAEEVAGLFTGSGGSPAPSDALEVSGDATSIGAGADVEVLAWREVGGAPEYRLRLASYDLESRLSQAGLVPTSTQSTGAGIEMTALDTRPQEGAVEDRLSRLGLAVTVTGR